MQRCTRSTTRTAAVWPSCLRFTDRHGSAVVRGVFTWTCTCTLIGTLAACNLIGPAGIRSGRGAYSSAINATNNQQTLKTIVSMRYGETTSLLAVSSVTANMKFASRGSFDLGVGPDQNYAGNLVPLSGSVVFEENPTISYTPLDGGEFIRELLSAIPLRLFLLILESGEPALTLRMLAASVNDIRNPDFLTGHEAETDGRFDRLVELIEFLERRGRLDWGTGEAQEQEFVVVIHGYAPGYVDEVQELLAVLELSALKADGEDIFIPIHLSVGSPKPDSMKIKTRSIYDLLRMAAASAEVPEKHAESGLALAYPPTGPGGERSVLEECPQRRGRRRQAPWVLVLH